MVERGLTLKDISDLELLKGNIKQELAQENLNLDDVKSANSKFRKAYEDQYQCYLNKEKQLEQEHHGKNGRTLTP